MMHYLECIALLEYLQKKLFAGQRQQVPISTVSEVHTVMVALNKRLEKEQSVEVKARLRDIMESIIAIKGTQGLTVLTDSMKTTLTAGIDELIVDLSLLSFEYFKLHEFEPTDQIIPVMRNVVSVALEKGVV